jgi:hypothetical protein
LKKATRVLTTRHGCQDVICHEVKPEWVVCFMEMALDDLRLDLLPEQFKLHAARDAESFEL